MATFILRHFSSPQALRTVRPEVLLKLLGRYRDYFARRDVVLDAPGGLNLDAIASVLMTPDEATPRGLIDDLYFVDDLATSDGMDRLLDAVRGAGLDTGLDQRASPAEVAVTVRMQWPDLMERQHAEHSLVQRRRTFEYFQAPYGADTAVVHPSPEAVAEAERWLGGRLEQLKRGRACKLFVFSREDGVWILVRRGDPFRRDGSIEEAGTGSVYYRPERYDVLRYDPRQGELAVNAEGNQRLVKLYRELVGDLLCGDRERLSKASKYTFAPLLNEGENALICSDIEGIDWVRLTEVQYYWGGPHSEIETRRAKDVFGLLRDQKRELPQGRIVRVTFKVKLRGVRGARAVTIRSRNVASYTHDTDAPLIEAWLGRRGFVTTTMEESDARADDALANP